MKLNREALKNKAGFQTIKLPTFDMETVERNTEQTPQWIHFGAGNIFRGFIARINHNILEKGAGTTGIVAVDTFDFDIIDQIYTDYDNLTLLVRLKADGENEKEVVAGVSKAYKANHKFEEYEKVVAIFENPSLQMVSFTITEKGYALKQPNGDYLGVVENDIKNGMDTPEHVMGIVTSLLYKRFEKGATPITLCSMDNCSHNGEKLRNAVIEIAKAWQKNDFVSAEFVAYVSDEEKVSFPWSMIDKITPRPAKSIEEELLAMGFLEMQPIVTSRNTFIAPFVNAEVCEYLVIEDKFVNGRPKLEEGGVYLTDRETVNKVETMKVTTCLNPLHTALAVYGCVLGYTRIFEEMKNPELKKLVEKIGFDESMPVVVDPKIIDPKAFINEVIYERLANPFIPDEPQRIATDTSQKVGIRFGETIKAYINDTSRNQMDLTFIPLAIAGWIRYLIGVDDDGAKFELSADPLLVELQEKLSAVSLGTYHDEALEILGNTNIFGVDLVACGLAEKINGMVRELVAEKGAVKNTLAKYLN